MWGQSERLWRKRAWTHHLGQIAVFSQLPFPPPWDLPNPGIKPTFPALAGEFFTTEPLAKPFSGGTAY